MNFVKLLIKDTTQLYRVIFDCLLLVTLIVLAQKCPQLGRSVTQRGFFCDDATLRYPYHEGTISNTMLYAIGLYLPLLVIGCVELVDFVVKVRSQRCSKSNDVAIANSMRKSLQQFYQTMSAYLLGYACERFFKALGKATVGRLRPHFFSVCQPQLPDGRTCADPLLAGAYIEEYSCVGGVNVTESMLRSVHLSFPSGHSSMSFYGMVFLALYFHDRLCRQHFSVRVMKTLLQLSCLLLAWFVMLSRIMDNMHHWSDALAGSLLGTLIAVFVYVSLLSGFTIKMRTKNQERCGCEKSAMKLNEVLTEVKSVPSDTKG